MNEEAKMSVDKEYAIAHVNIVLQMVQSGGSNSNQRVVDELRGILGRLKAGQISPDQAMTLAEGASEGFSSPVKREAPQAQRKDEGKKVRKKYEIH